MVSTRTSCWSRVEGAVPKTGWDLGLWRINVNQQIGSGIIVKTGRPPLRLDIFCRDARPNLLVQFPQFPEFPHSIIHTFLTRTIEFVNFITMDIRGGLDKLIVIVLIIPNQIPWVFLERTMPCLRRMSVQSCQIARVSMQRISGQQSRRNWRK